ncbi:TetR/AcrR family transcriptional regulator [Micromonospora sp. NPDC050397]|uniref:TetR/AcrR family transcriptional regulator n=1 Tax=Micromonospora sp. NPDC050397 TaxID=3364279 RepID=UPI00384F8823
MSESTGSTRARIQAVALELFTEQGYEKTSLREISERLGVTKAALYYHFKSKDDIVNSFVEDRLGRLDALIELGKELPVDAATRRRELLSCYAEEFFGSTGHSVMRFFDQNQTVLKSLPAGQMMRERMIRLATVLAAPEDSANAQLRATLALFAVHSSWFALRDREITDSERRDLALEIAHELLDRIGTAGS